MKCQNENTKTKDREALLFKKRTRQRQLHRDTEIGNVFLKSILLGLLTSYKSGATQA